jgi:von Willebrand factor type A C-terminal domain/von Willebrand factor type A domain
MSQQNFQVEVYQNEYLPSGGREVNAIVTVTAAGSGQAASGQPSSEPAATGHAVGSAGGRAEIIIVDCSGSMEYPHAKIVQARAATATAIDVISDGVAFAIVAGTDHATPVFPHDGSLAVASATSREAARRVTAQLQPSGGTAMGTWLLLARQMFASASAPLRHAILLTDGRNEHESAETLTASIAACEGLFSCDCRGVGTDWEVAELRRISSALLGTVDIVADPAGLAADFASMMHAAMDKQVADVMLRIWTPQHAELRFVKQVAPAVQDLTARRTPTGPQAGDYPTGSWAGGESRDYHVCVQVSSAAVGQEMLAARVSLISGADVMGQGLVRAVWTDDEALSTRINANVAHYTGQAELAQVIQDGLEARKRGDDEAATAKLGRAVALAEQSGNEDTARLLAKVVDVIDAPSGTVRLKRAVADADEMALDTRSTKTVRTRK